MSPITIALLFCRQVRRVRTTHGERVSLIRLFDSISPPKVPIRLRSFWLFYQYTGLPIGDHRLRVRLTDADDRDIWPPFGIGARVDDPLVVGQAVVNLSGLRLPAYGEYLVQVGLDGHAPSVARRLYVVNPDGRSGG